LNSDPLVYSSQAAGITGMYHHAQLFLLVEIVSREFFARAGLELVILLISAS
jgi:hypothetical protein